MTLKVNFTSLVTEDRKLSFCPEHFVKTGIAFSDEKILWVYESTKGRFSVYEKPSDDTDFDLIMWSLESKCLAFEDPHEAVLCELTWS